MPSLAQSTRSPSSPNTTGPTMLPAFSARTWSSSRSASSETSRSSISGSDSFWPVEGVLVRVLDRVLGAVVDLPQRGRQVRALQLGQGVGHQHRLHELLGHADVEERARLLALPISMMPRFSLKLTLARLRTGIESAGPCSAAPAVITMSATPMSFFSTAPLFFGFRCAMSFPISFCALAVAAVGFLTNQRLLRRCRLGVNALLPRLLPFALAAGYAL